MIEPGVLARTVSDYTHRRPSESPTLAPLWQTLAQHAKAGACHHRGTCPLVTVGPVVVNEHHEVLMVRGGRAPARLPEARLTEGFDTLAEAAFDLARGPGRRAVVDPARMRGPDPVTHRPCVPAGR